VQDQKCENPVHKDWIETFEGYYGGLVLECANCGVEFKSSDPRILEILQSCDDDEMLDKSVYIAVSHFDDGTPCDRQVRNNMKIVRMVLET